MAKSIHESLRFKPSGIITPNRTVLAAMTNKQSHDDGRLSNNELKWLKRRAEGGFGVVTTAAAHVSKDGQAWEGELGVFDDIHIDDLSRLAKAIHKEESLLIAQLFHGGLQADENLTGSIPISASRTRSKTSRSGFSKQASEIEIIRLISDFKDAAQRCQEAGFDGVEIHGAHGYLITQFLGTKTNLRSDHWGGDLNNRSRLLIEILKMIREELPENFIVGVRISPEIKNIGIKLDDSIQLAKKVSDMDIDFIHISCWDVFKRSIEYPNVNKTLTQWFTESCENLPTVISTGGIWSKKNADDLLKQGADLVGVGKVGIGYPDWAKEVMKEEYDPKKPPFTSKQLKEVQLSDVFIDYMRKWDGFVTD